MKSEGIWYPKFGSINFALARMRCIEACLEAMIEGRRFDYTDMFVS